MLTELSLPELVGEILVSLKSIIFFLITSEGQNFILGFFTFLFSSLNNISTVLSFCFFDLCIYSIFFFAMQYVNQHFKFNSDIFKIEG